MATFVKLNLRMLSLTYQFFCSVECCYKVLIGVMLYLKRYDKKNIYSYILILMRSLSTNDRIKSFI